MPDPDHGQIPEQRRRLTGDDKVVIVASVAGVGGGIVGAIFRLPPIIISVLIAIGATALLYRFLGGIQGASLAVGALKVTGSVAVLIGLSIGLNHILVEQLPPVPLTQADLPGEWKWVYARGAWEGHLDFKQGPAGLSFTGQEFSFEKPGSPVLIYRLTEGKATLVRGGRALELEMDVEDLRLNRKFRLKSTQPLLLVPAFRGDLRAVGTDSSDPWGIMIYKRLPGSY